MAKVQLHSGGEIEVSLEKLNLFELSKEDRTFVFDIVDRVRDYLSPADNQKAAETISLAPPQAVVETKDVVDRARMPSGSVPEQADPVGKAPIHSARTVTMPAGSAGGRNQAVLEFLRSRGEAAAGIQEILNHLAGLGFRGLLPKDVGNTLNGLKQRKLVDNPSRGMWTAVRSEPPAPPPPSTEEQLESPPDEHGEQPPEGALGKLLEEIRAKKEPVELKPDAQAGERPRPFVPEPPSFRPDVEEERKAKELKDLEAVAGQAADALPLASGGPCKWHGGCGDPSERLVPSYYGGRLTSMYELCRPHSLKKIFADRLTPARAEAFAADQAAGKAVV